jgi:hypothetical protein
LQLCMAELVGSAGLPQHSPLLVRVGEETHQPPRHSAPAPGRAPRQGHHRCRPTRSAPVPTGSGPDPASPPNRPPAPSPPSRRPSPPRLPPSAPGSCTGRSPGAVPPPSPTGGAPQPRSDPPSPWASAPPARPCRGTPPTPATTPRPRPPLTLHQQQPRTPPCPTPPRARPPPPRTRWPTPPPPTRYADGRLIYAHPHHRHVTRQSTYRPHESTPNDRPREGPERVVSSPKNTKGPNGALEVLQRGLPASD